MSNRFALPPHLTLKNYEGLNLGTIDKTNDSGLSTYVADQIDRSLNWKDVKWLQTITNLPILVKGVLTAEDASLAVEVGVAGIIVSNHGARQLDYVPATITALEEVVKAARGRVPVFLDGGIRRGTDVFKALALGASGVFAMMMGAKLKQGEKCSHLQRVITHVTDTPDVRFSQGRERRRQGHNKQSMESKKNI